MRLDSPQNGPAIFLAQEQTTMGRRVNRQKNRRALKRREIASTSSRKFPRKFEQLEARQMLSATQQLFLTTPTLTQQTIVGGANVNASNDPATRQNDMSVDINPTN